MLRLRLVWKLYAVTAATKADGSAALKNAVPATMVSAPRAVHSGAVSRFTPRRFLGDSPSTSLLAKRQLLDFGNYILSEALPAKARLYRH